MKQEVIESLYASLVGKWVRIESPKTVAHNFTFNQWPINITVESGERRLSLWMAYLSSCHKEIKVTPIN